MLSENDWTEFTRRFPALGIERKSNDLIRQFAQVRVVEADEVLYRDGDECTHLPMLIDGELVLNKHGETGRAITLYRVEDGESCILSTLSILNHVSFPAEAVTNRKSTLVLIPAAVLRELIGANPAWRDFVFATYHRRLSGLIALIEEVVFRKLDLRLADLLLQNAEPGGGGGPLAVRQTHQALAVQLGSSREVVSRVLKEWERQGILSLSRGIIYLNGVEALKNLSAGRD